jgi:hypothetical protein
MRAYESTSYAEWLATNFLAVPMLMLAAWFAVMTAMFIAVAIRNRGIPKVPGNKARLMALVGADALIAWGVYAVMDNVYLPCLLTVANGLWIGIPTLFICALMWHIWQNYPPTGVSQRSTPSGHQP